MKIKSLLFFFTLIFQGCVFVSKDERILAEHQQTNGSKIQVLYVAVGATANDNIQVRKYGQDNPIWVSEKYDSLLNSKLLGDTLQLILGHIGVRNEGGKFDTVLISLSQTSTKSVKDTTIEYSIEGISAEGSNAVAKYVKGKITECAIGIFAETGQIKILYSFRDGKIAVSEKQYAYKAGIESVNTAKDMRLKKEISYVMDENGVPVGKMDGDRTDVFPEFKKAVPLVIK